MGVPGIMHKEATLLYNIREIRTGECKVLESAGETAVQGGIMEGGSVGGREFGCGVDGGGDRFAVKHAGVIQNLERILLLGEVEAGGCMVDVYAEEMVKGAHVSHRELAVEGGYDGLEESGCTGGEYDIVDVEEEVSHVSAAMERKQRGVHLGTLEPMVERYEVNRENHALGACLSP